MITKDDIRKEIGTELFMREKVWRMADKKTKRFANSEHQRRYNTLRYNAAILDVMTDKEFLVLKERIDRRIEEAKAQQTLDFNTDQP